MSAHIQVVFRVLYRSAVVQAENMGTYFDLNEVKYLDKQTSFEPHLELRTVHGRSNSNSSGSSNANSQSSSFGLSDGKSFGITNQFNLVESQKNTNQHGQSGTYTNNHSASSSDTTNETWVTNHIKHIEYSPRFYPLSEQYYMFTSALVNQHQRMATVRIGERSPFQIHTLDVESAELKPKFKKWVYWSHSCYTPLYKAKEQISRLPDHTLNKPKKRPENDPRNPFT